MASIALRKKKTLLQYNRRAFVLVVYGEVVAHSLVALIPVVAIATGANVFEDIQHLKEVIWVEPAEGVSHHDHVWDSESFKPIIKNHIDQFTEEYRNNL